MAEITISGDRTGRASLSVSDGRYADEKEVTYTVPEGYYATLVWKCTTTFNDSCYDPPREPVTATYTSEIFKELRYGDTTRTTTIQISASPGTSAGCVASHTLDSLEMVLTYMDEAVPVEYVIETSRLSPKPNGVRMVPRSYSYPTKVGGSDYRELKSGTVTEIVAGKRYKVTVQMWSKLSCQLQHSFDYTGSVSRLKFVSKGGYGGTHIVAGTDSITTESSDVWADTDSTNITVTNAVPSHDIMYLEAETTIHLACVAHRTGYTNGIGSGIVTVSASINGVQAEDATGYDFALSKYFYGWEGLACSLTCEVTRPYGYDFREWRFLSSDDYTDPGDRTNTAVVTTTSRTFTRNFYPTYDDYGRAYVLAAAWFDKLYGIIYDNDTGRIMYDPATGSPMYY